MAGGIMFYGTTMIILHIAKENTVQSQEFIYRYFSYFFSFVSIPISTWLFKNTIGKKTGNTLREKLIAYRSAHILRTALLEIPGLIAVTIFSISGDWIALIPAPIALIFIVLNIPSPQRIILELELDEKEASVLHAPGSRLFES
jgi:hypothetical protein